MMSKHQKKEMHRDPHILNITSTIQTNSRCFDVFPKKIKKWWQKYKSQPAADVFDAFPKTEKAEVVATMPAPQIQKYTNNNSNNNTNNNTNTNTNNDTNTKN